MCDGHSSPFLTPTASPEGSRAALSRANTIDKSLDLADCLGHALTFPDSISDPHLRSLLEVLQEDLPDQIYDAILRIIQQVRETANAPSTAAPAASGGWSRKNVLSSRDCVVPISTEQVLGKEVEVSAAEFQRYLGFLTKDNVGELRRACLRGKARLHAMGWRPHGGTAVAPGQQQSEVHLSRTGTSASRPAKPPTDAASETARALVAAAAADRRAKHAPISSRGRVICKASMRSGLGRLRTAPTPPILDDCERQLATLKLAF